MSVLQSINKCITTSKLFFPYFHKQTFNSIWRNYGNLSYLHKVGSDPLRAITIGNLLQEAATKYKDKPMVISRHQNKVLSFEQVLEESDRLAAALVTMGLGKGDRVGLYLTNRYEWIVAFFACTRADLILVALNPAYQWLELESSINKVGISALICGDHFKSQNYYEILKKACPEISESEPGKINSERTPSLKHAIFISDESFSGCHNYEEILGLGDQNGIKDIKNGQDSIDADNPSVVQFRSGTTGSHKATVSTHFHMVNNSYSGAKRLELHENDHIVCLPNPLFHVIGITLNTIAALHYGTTFVLPDAGHNPNKTLDAIKEERCTILHGTPTMHIDLINAQLKRQEDINLEMAVIAGATASPKLFKDMIDVLKVKKTRFAHGSTECSGAIFQSLPEDDKHLSTTTVGMLGDHIEAKVIDPQGRKVPFGQRGELCIRGYLTMLGYWEDGNKNNEVIKPDGWLKTGDLFILNENGYGRVVGRLKDMIIRGGENIFPKEIEDFLDTHPDILESQVIGVPHERLGEEICAFVRLKKGKVLDKDGLAEFCIGNIAHFKIPSRLVIVNYFSKTVSGKIEKIKLKELMKSYSQ